MMWGSGIGGVGEDSSIGDGDLWWGGCVDGEEGSGDIWEVLELGMRY